MSKPVLNQAEGIWATIYFKMGQIVTGFVTEIERFGGTLGIVDAIGGDSLAKPIYFTPESVSKIVPVTGSHQEDLVVRAMRTLRERKSKPRSKSPTLNLYTEDDDDEDSSDGLDDEIDEDDEPPYGVDSIVI